MIRSFLPLRGGETELLIRRHRYFSGLPLAARQAWPGG
jgi:hypothetical protein